MKQKNLFPQQNQNIYQDPFHIETLDSQFSDTISHIKELLNDISGTQTKPQPRRSHNPSWDDMLPQKTESKPIKTPTSKKTHNITNQDPQPLQGIQELVTKLHTPKGRQWAVQNTGLNELENITQEELHLIINKILHKILSASINQLAKALTIQISPQNAAPEEEGRLTDVFKSFVQEYLDETFTSTKKKPPNRENWFAPPIEEEPLIIPEGPLPEIPSKPKPPKSETTEAKDKLKTSHIDLPTLDMSDCETKTTATTIPTPKPNAITQFLNKWKKGLIFASSAAAIAFTFIANTTTTKSISTPTQITAKKLKKDQPPTHRIITPPPKKTTKKIKPTSDLQKENQQNANLECPPIESLKAEKSRSYFTRLWRKAFKKTNKIPLCYPGSGITRVIINMADQKVKESKIKSDKIKFYKALRNLRKAFKKAFELNKHGKYVKKKNISKQNHYIKTETYIKSNAYSPTGEKLKSTDSHHRGTVYKIDKDSKKIPKLLRSLFNIIRK